MITYQITVEYLGTNFVGWQFQKNGLSIQEVLESALSRYLKENIRVIGSGRTDSGVHASEQSAHFKTKNKIVLSFFGSTFLFVRMVSKPLEWRRLVWKWRGHQSI